MAGRLELHGKYLVIGALIYEYHGIKNRGPAFEFSRCVQHALLVVRAVVKSETAYCMTKEYGRVKTAFENSQRSRCRRTKVPKDGSKRFVAGMQGAAGILWKHRLKPCGSVDQAKQPPRRRNVIRTKQGRPSSSHITR